MEKLLTKILGGGQELREGTMAGKGGVNNEGQVSVKGRRIGEVRRSRVIFSQRASSNKKEESSLMIPNELPGLLGKPRLRYQSGCGQSTKIH